MKAIETRYKGYRFRSRLEARWAVFFDTLGIRWEYEPEGFELDGVRYLPDFWLPDLNAWFEVKGERPSGIELEKASRLTTGSERPVFIAWGGLDGEIWEWNTNVWTPTEPMGGRHWGHCDACQRYVIGLYSHADCGGVLDYRNSAILAAFSAAHSARFEFGEQGTPKLQLDKDAAHSVVSPTEQRWLAQCAEDIAALEHVFLVNGWQLIQTDHTRTVKPEWVSQLCAGGDHHFGMHGPWAGALQISPRIDVSTRVFFCDSDCAAWWAKSKGFAPRDQQISKALQW